MMQATSRPWSWSGRRATEGVRRDGRGGRRVRLRLADLQLRPLKLDWRPDLPAAFYTPNQIRHLIRWEAAMGAIPTLPTVPTWLRDPARPWRLPDLTVNLEPRPTLSSLPVGVVADTGGGGSGSSWWSGAARGLPLGAALLAMLLLLLRAADSCLHTGFFKLPLRRRQSEEWPTPSVMATNLTVRMSSEVPGSELPPPYSEAVVAPKPPEDPPPPYSACYVTYSNPPERAPSVQVFTPRHTALLYGYEEGRSGLLDDLDTGQRTGFGTTSPGCDEETSQISNDDGVIQRLVAEDQNETSVVLSAVSATETENISTDSREVAVTAHVQRNSFLVV